MIRPLHTKRKRVSREDAHRFRKNGTHTAFSKEDFLSDEDRQKIVHKISQDLQETTKSKFPRTNNLEYAILKAHLIVEFAITEYIRATSFLLVEPERLNFTFFNKLEIAILHGMGAGYPTLVPSIELLNKIRNQVAHKFTFDKQLVRELALINSENGVDPPSTDRQCISFLRSLCAFICGVTAGQIEMAILLSNRV